MSVIAESQQKVVAVTIKRLSDHAIGNNGFDWFAAVLLCWVIRKINENANPCGEQTKSY